MDVIQSPGATGDLHPCWEERDGQGALGVAQPRVLAKLQGAKDARDGSCLQEEPWQWSRI